MNRGLLLLVFLVFTCTSFGQISIEDLHIDTTITGFHFAADFEGTRVFTKNGPPDIQSINPTAFSFTIAPGMTAAAAKEQLYSLVNLSTEYGYKISNYVTKDTLLKGYTAYYISYTETGDGGKYKNTIFNAFVIKDKTLVLFVSGDLDNGKFTDRFKKTFYSIRL